MQSSYFQERKYRRFLIRYPLQVMFDVAGSPSEPRAISNNVSLDGILLEAATPIPQHLLASRKVTALENASKEASMSKLFWLALFITISATNFMAQVRGYVTTPGELQTIATKAAAGTQPYANAVLSIKNYANTESSAVSTSVKNATYWPYGTITGEQACLGSTLTPSYLGNGSPLIEAKALVYGLTGDTDYAADVRTHLLDLTDTFGYNQNLGDPDTYSGGNQCVLNLSWYIPGFIIAADLIDGYSGWSAADKASFQTWLATVVYKKVDWASDARSNNWGAAGSATSAYIADYINGAMTMTDRTGATITSAAAYAKHKQRQIDRLNGNTYMDNFGCPSDNLGEGIKGDVPAARGYIGGIPWEEVRGAAGCDGNHMTQDASADYQTTHLQGTFSHAELLLRRGDSSLYDHIGTSAETGCTGGCPNAGQIRKAVDFLLDNPNGNVNWANSSKSDLEFAYRYYHNTNTTTENTGIEGQLGIGGTRLILGRSGQMLHFGTLTHGFAVGEQPTLPPTVPPPTMSGGGTGGAPSAPSGLKALAQ